MSATFDALQARCHTVSGLRMAGVRIVPLFGGFVNYDLDSLRDLYGDWPYKSGRFELRYIAPVNAAAALLGLPPVDGNEDDYDMFVLPAETEVSAQDAAFDCEYALILWPDKTA